MLTPDIGPARVREIVSRNFEERLLALVVTGEVDVGWPRKNASGGRARAGRRRR